MTTYSNHPQQVSMAAQAAAHSILEVEYGGLAKPDGLQQLWAWGHLAEYASKLAERMLFAAHAEGYTQDEIAAVLGITRQRVSQRLAKGHQEALAGL